MANYMIQNFFSNGPKTCWWVHWKFAPCRNPEKINKGQQGYQFLPEIGIQKWLFFYKSLIFIPFKSCMSWKAGNSIAMISVMSKSAYCSSKSTHWHHFCSWLLIQRESFQGVTGRGMFTWHWSYLSLVMLPGHLVIAWTILVWKFYSSSFSQQSTRCSSFPFRRIPRRKKITCRLKMAVSPR